MVFLRKNILLRKNWLTRVWIISIAFADSYCLSSMECTKSASFSIFIAIPFVLVRTLLTLAAKKKGKCNKLFNIIDIFFITFLVAKH